MKLLHVVAGMDPKQGGVGQAIRTIVTGLNASSVYNEIVCLDAENASYLNDDPFLIHAVGTEKGLWSYSSKLIPWLSENLFRFDVVILHGLWLYPGVALRIASRRLKRNKTNTSRLPKLFVMPHGMLDPYFQRAPDRKLKALRNWFYWKLIESKIVNQADGLLFTCEEERRLAKESFNPYNPKQELVVGLGVEIPPTFTSQMEKAFLEKCPSLLNRPYFLFLSRVHEKKGVDLLIKAYKKILAKKSKYKLFDEIDAAKEESFQDEEYNNELPVLVIAGPGLDTPFGKRVHAIATGSKILKDFVLFPGMLSGDAKWGAFYGCEAFLLPSHQENFGIAVVESLACGKPVLISNKVNIWQEIATDGAGLIGEDTEIGIYNLINEWQNYSFEAKQKIIDKTQLTYNKYFSIVPNVKRFFNAVNNL